MMKLLAIDVETFYHFMLGNDLWFVRRDENIEKYLPSGKNPFLSKFQSIFLIRFMD